MKIIVYICKIYHKKLNTMKKFLLLTLALVITSCSNDLNDCHSGRVLRIDQVITQNGYTTSRVQVEDICSLTRKSVTITTYNGIAPGIGEIIQY